RFEVPRNREPVFNPMMGVISGLLAGMTGAFTMPSVVYLQSTLLPRDQLVQALGMVFILSTVGLGFSMAAQNLLSRELLLVSAASLVPAFAGVFFGTHMRKRTSEERFRLIFLVALGLLGLYITSRSLFAIFTTTGL
ncbi:MAG: sulfite exporter TauE/SafE family protein, partial [Pseudomonadota bacterium]